MRVVDTVWGDWAPGQHQYLLNFADDQGGDKTTYDFDIGKWKCAEWHLDGNAKKFRLWEDGNPVTFEGGNTEVNEGDIPNYYSETRIGLKVYQEGVNV